MKITYFDCISGASGDMILGALIDVGLPIERLQNDLELLKLDGYELQSRQVLKNGFRATKVDVLVKEDVPERHLKELLGIVENSQLPEAIKIKASAIFTRLAEVEAGIHGTTLDKVHLHELGGIDTMVDVIGAFLGLDALGVEKVFSSPVPLGRGFIRGAHGQIPLPSPATIALLKGVPVTGSDVNFELVTPTGAALLTTLAESFGPIPAMTLEAVGYGAGGRDLPIPNIIRILLGEKEGIGTGTLETLVTLETNIDDLNPQVYDYLMGKLFENNALDVSLTPIQMKKNRPAVQVWVLCRPQDEASLEKILFEGTSTLGIRRGLVERHSLPRSFQTVETPYGPVKVKLAHLSGGRRRPALEFEDCKKIAQEQGVPLWEVYLTVYKILNLDNPSSNE
jgi:pyridinium-3,5-bisthiocarboxylic acid mononucleotide nickel chelatase